MNSSEKSILENITQEVRLPEIDVDTCVHALCNESDCNACVAICPKQAWILDYDKLGLDIEACDGCGLCIPACPGGALHIHFPWVIRTLGYRMIALFACEKSAVKESNGIMPCIHALGLRQLLQLYNAGIEVLLVATEQCTDCSCITSGAAQPETLYTRVKQLNSMLIERHKPPMSILKRSSTVWKKIYNTDEAINKGSQLSRRNFLQGGGQQFREQLVIMDPLNLPECRTLPPGQLLPEAESSELKWPWVPAINKSRCSGCDACTRLCPTDALQLLNDNDTQSAQYKINPANCTGCGLCSSVCESAAISINYCSYIKTDTIDLFANNCKACGNIFHVPKLNTQSDQELCRICENHNHSKNLFQVLE